MVKKNEKKKINEKVNEIKDSIKLLHIQSFAVEKISIYKLLFLSVFEGD